MQYWADVTFRVRSTVVVARPTSHDGRVERYDARFFRAFFIFLFSLRRCNSVFTLLACPQRTTFGVISCRQIHRCYLAHTARAACNRGWDRRVYFGRGCGGGRDGTGQEGENIFDLRHDAGRSKRLGEPLDHLSRRRVCFRRRFDAT